MSLFTPISFDGAKVQSNNELTNRFYQKLINRTFFFLLRIKMLSTHVYLPETASLPLYCGWRF